MLKHLFTFIFLTCSTFVFAADFVADNRPIFYHPKGHLQNSSRIHHLTTEVSKIDFFSNSKDWSTTWPAADRVLLSHRSKKQFILVVEYKTNLTNQEANRYFLNRFSRDAKASRSTGLSIEGSTLKNVDADSIELSGSRVGRVSFDIDFPDTAAQFSERIWLEKGHLWQISMVSMAAFSGDPNAHNSEMDSVMETIRGNPKRLTSWLDFVMPFTEAPAMAAEVVDSGSHPSVTQTAPGLHMPTPSECKAEKIPDEKRAAPGLKISLSVSGVDHCGAGLRQGFDVMVEATKASFISGFQSVQHHAEENSLKNPCPEPMPLPPHATFSQMMDISQNEQLLADCTQANFGLAMVQTAGDIAQQTLKGVSSLVNWVRTTKDPVAVISAMIQAKAPGFMCVNADTQTKMYCEFVGAAMTAVAATAAGGALTGGAGALASGATLTEAGAAALLAGNRAAMAILASPYTVPRDLAKATVNAGGTVATGLRNKVNALRDVTSRDVAGPKAPVAVAHDTNSAVVKAESPQSQIHKVSINGKMQEVKFELQPPKDATTHPWDLESDAEAGHVVVTLPDGREIGRFTFHFYDDGKGIHTVDLNVESKFRQSEVADKIWEMIHARYPNAKRGESGFSAANKILGETNTGHAKDSPLESDLLNDGMRAKQGGRIARSETSTMQINGKQEPLTFTNREVLKFGNEYNVVTARMKDGKSIGSFGYYLEQGGREIQAGLLKVEEQYQKNGIAEQLWRNIRASHPEAKTISSDLGYTNLDEIHRALKKGASCIEAIKITPSYKIREKIGCAKIISATCNVDELAHLVVQCD